MSDDEAVRAKYKDICDSYKKARMNVLLYEQRLSFLKKRSFYADVIIGISSCGAIAAWNIFKASIGATTWSLVLGIGALLSFLKPTMQLPEQIEKCSTQRTGYSDLYFDLQALLSNINISKEITNDNWLLYQDITKKFKELAKTDEIFSDKVIAKVQNKVNATLPDDSLCYPVT